MENKLTIDANAIRVWDTHRIQNLQEKIIKEEPVNIYLNGDHFVTLLALPKLHQELALGHLLSEGIIKSLEEVESFKQDNNDVYIVSSKIKKGRLNAHRVLKLVTSACGSTSDYLRLLDSMDPPKVTSQLQIHSTKILEMRVKLMRVKYPVHIAALFSPDATMISIAEDVGRHNAVDKVIGAVSLSKISFEKLILLSSGRVPADMVLKAARMGIPILGSFSGPISSGIMFAKKSNVTLISYLRRNRFNIYTHFNRIKVPSIYEDGLSLPANLQKDS